ncbi:phage head-tail joining protein [Sphingobium sp. R-7]|uniref:phage head-tail joining protein n=1 Tax=Sphingobium sp. R-7 TaxID=3375449 RepID=UPI00398B08B5
MTTWTTSDLITVRSAIASGIRSVTFADGRKTEYQSLDQLLAAELVIEAALKMQAQAVSGVLRRRTPYYRNGL